MQPNSDIYPKMFVLVRNDLKSASYKAVQAGHAVANYFLKYYEKNSGERPLPLPHNWDNGYMIYLRVKNEDELCKWIYKLQQANITYSEFKEPDIGNEVTAVACILKDDNFFKKLKLL